MEESLLMENVFYHKIHGNVMERFSQCQPHVMDCVRTPLILTELINLTMFSVVKSVFIELRPGTVMDDASIFLNRAMENVNQQVT